MKYINSLYNSILIIISTLVLFSFFKFINFSSKELNFYYLKYLILFILLLIISLFFKKKKILYFTYLFSLTFPIYLIEISLNFKIFENFIIDNRSRIEVYNETKIKNKAITIAGHNFLNDNNIDLFPLSGVSNVYTIFCNENGYYNNYNSDRFGFNNLDKNWDNRNVNFIIGDSFAHGACVKEDFARILIKKLNSKFLNLGMSGNGPLLNQAILQEYLNYKQPVSVFYFHYEGNDIYNLNNEINNKFLAQYLNINFSQNLINRQNEIDLLLKNKISKKFNEKKNILDAENNKGNFLFLKELLVMTKFRKYFFYKLFPTQKIKTNSDVLYKYNRDLYLFNEYKNISQKEKKYVDGIQRIIENLKQLSNINNFKLYFIYIPTYDRFKLEENYYDEIQSFDFWNKNKLFRILKTHQISIIDLYDFIKKNNYKSFYPGGGHFNQKGYYKITDFIISQTNLKKN